MLQRNMLIKLAVILYFWNVKGQFKHCTTVIEMFKNLVRKKSCFQRNAHGVCILKCDQPNSKEEKITLSSVLEVISAMMGSTSNQLISSIKL